MPRNLAAYLAQLSVPLLLLFALAIPGVPQTQDPAAPIQRPRKVFPKEQEPEDVLRIDTDLVSVDVTAIDAEGRPVKNLRQEDFKLYSDGVERPISFFQIEQRQGARPLAVVFALDVSGQHDCRRARTIAFCAQLFFESPVESSGGLCSRGVWDERENDPEVYVRSQKAG